MLPQSSFAVWTQKCCFALCLYIIDKSVQPNASGLAVQ